MMKTQEQNNELRAKETHNDNKFKDILIGSYGLSQSDFITV